MKGDLETLKVGVGRLRAVVGPPAASPRRAEKIGGDPPEWIQIFPDGEYECEDGTYLCDEESRRLVLEHFAARGNDLVVDYEHQTLVGEEAPAAGWIRELGDRGKDGLWARVEWTERAKEYLRSGEYRYDSPVFDIDVKSRQVVALHHLALTNWPGSNNRTPLTEQIAASVRARRTIRQKVREGVMQIFENVKWWLNLKTTTTHNELRTELQKVIDAIPADDVMIMAEKAGEEPQTIAQAIGLLTEAPASGEPAPTQVVAAKALLDELDLPETATVAQAHARIGELKTRTSPEEVEQLRAENATLKTRIGELEAKTEDEKVAQLIESNRAKVPPAKEAWVRTLAKKHGLEHAAEVVRNMREELPVPTPAGDRAAEPPLPTTTVAASRRVRDKQVPVDPESATRKQKVEAIQKEKACTYNEAWTELKRRESAGS